MNPNIELLEDRTNPSITFVNGIVTVVGTDGTDFVSTINMVGDRSQVLIEQVSGGREYHSLTVPASALTAINVDLKGGNDYFMSWAVAPFDEFVQGGDGSDFIIGGWGGGGGILDGGNGDDWVLAGDHPGKVKQVIGGKGSDILIGGWGEDVVTADSEDYLYGIDPSEDTVVMLP